MLRGLSMGGLSDTTGGQRLIGDICRPLGFPFWGTLLAHEQLQTHQNMPAQLCASHV